MTFAISNPPQSRSSSPFGCSPLATSPRTCRGSFCLRILTNGRFRPSVKAYSQSDCSLVLKLVCQSLILSENNLVLPVIRITAPKQSGLEFSASARSLTLYYAGDFSNTLGVSVTGQVLDKIGIVLILNPVYNILESNHGHRKAVRGKATDAVGS